MTTATPTTVNQAEFAALLGCNKSHVTRLKQAGRLVLTAEGLVDVEKSRALIAATADPGKDHVAERHAAARGDAPRTPPAAVDTTIGNSYQTARAVNEKYRALTAKAEYEQKIGKLIERELVEQALADVVAFARQGMENMPQNLAGLLVGKDFEQINAQLRQWVIDRMSDMHKEAGKQLAELTRVET